MTTAVEAPGRGAAGVSARRTLQLVVHLTHREFRLRYRGAALGWLWAVLPASAQLLVLGFVFTRVVPVREEHYVADLAVGLLAWNWFSGGVSRATRSAADRRELLRQPGLPRPVVPLVSVLTDALDYLATLPVLLVVIVAVTGTLPGTIVLLPVVLVLQGALTLGVGMACSVADVRLRDTRLGVGLVLLVSFYATPVFYTVSSIPEDLRPVLALNPMAALIEAQRSLAVDGRLPDPSTWIVLLVTCLLVAAAGWVLYGRSSGDFLDAL